MFHSMTDVWDHSLPVLYTIGDGGTGIFFSAILILVIYIYRAGHLRRVVAAFPKMWQRGAIFVFFCALNFFGSVLEVWVGGWVRHLVGINKTCMLISAAMFACKFWKRRNDLVLIGRFAERAQEMVDRK